MQAERMRAEVVSANMRMPKPHGRGSALIAVSMVFRQWGRPIVRRIVFERIRKSPAGTQFQPCLICSAASPAEPAGGVHIAQSWKIRRAIEALRPWPPDAGPTDMSPIRILIPSQRCDLMGQRVHMAQRISRTKREGHDYRGP